MQVTFTDRKSWRAWLDEHGQDTREVWLVFYKKHTGRPCLSYEAAVEEALCVGWIDSIVKRLDDDRYLRKFTPRANTGQWSESNRKRVRRLKAAERMTAAGLAVFKPRRKATFSASSRALELPDYFAKALAKDKQAREFFENLAPSYRRDFIAWVDSAKREETRMRRLAEALDRLRNGKNLGMK